MPGCRVIERVWKAPDFKIYHLGDPAQPEWLDLNKTPVDGRDLNHPFVLEEVAQANPPCCSGSNVKYAWSVSVNGKKLGQLPSSKTPS